MQPCESCKTSLHTEFTKAHTPRDQVWGHHHCRWIAGESYLRNHFASTHRPEPSGIVERAVKRVKVGTSSVLLLSGLDERWWAESTECYCDVRNVHHLVYHSERKSNIIRYQLKIRQGTISLKKYSQASYGPRTISGRKLGRRHTRYRR